MGPVDLSLTEHNDSKIWGGVHLIRTFLVATVLLLWSAAAAAEPGRRLDQYEHQRWSEESDAPRPVVSMAQDARGYLWLATGAGLFRFDGVRFELISNGLDLLVHGAPSAVLIRSNGDIWTNFERSGRFAVYRDGRLNFLRAPRAPDRIMAMREASDGTVWALTERIGRQLMRFQDGKWRVFGTNSGAPLENPMSMVVTRDGTVWVSFTGSVARMAPGKDRFEFVQRKPSALGRLSVDPSGMIWFTEREGSYPLTGRDGRGEPPPLRHAYATDSATIRGWPTFDREGNLWISTYYDGLQRVARPDPRGAPTAHDAVLNVEHITEREGLTSNAMGQIFQDREGNVWVGSKDGLDRFWPATLRFESQLTDPAAFGDILLQASDGSVYIGQASTVYRVRPRGPLEPIFSSAVEPRTLCEAPDGAIWIGTSDKKVAIWKQGRVQRLVPKAPLAYTIYDCAFDAGGNYWITASLGGLARWRGGRWEPTIVSPGRDFAPKSMVTDERGGLILQWNDRTLARIENGKSKSALIPFGGYQPDDVALHPVSPGKLLVAGRFGLARLQNGQFKTISARRAPLFSGVNGIVQTPGGDTWLAGTAGLLRIPTVQLERAFLNAKEALPITVFGAGDGLRSPAHDHSRRSIVRGGDGRLWIATQMGTVWLDPADISRSGSPPSIAISSLRADKLYRDPTAIRLPAGTSNLEIDFSVISFSNPHSARVRFRMEGLDPVWIEANARRQAFFTNLAPGNYRFWVIAANQDGIWNRQGASVEIVIPPTFVQSRWFLALCVMLALFLLFLAYRLRVAQVAAKIRNGLEERMAERERIARELHDTLLQSVQGLVLRFQSVANKMPPEASNRAHLEAALDRADEIMAEGRDRVQDLRIADNSQNLPELLKQRAAAVLFDPEVSLRIVVEGKSRPVHPLVSVELGSIASEALFNIARHAHAKSIEIVVRFGVRHLAVEIRDDGVGLAREVIEEGHKPGHFGLIGMRERAERIGSSFSLDSYPGLGTAVSMTLPARLAYSDQAPRHRLLARLFARWKEHNRG